MEISSGILTVMLLVALLVMMFAGLPVAFTLGLLSLMLLLYNGGPKLLGIISTTAFGDFTNFVFIALPLFIFMSSIVSVSGMADDIYDVTSKWLGRLPGGLAMASVAAAAAFGAICGSSVATAAAIGMIAIPAMVKQGYNRAFAIGTVAAAGCLGQLIPPSMPMIIYGAITEQSIGQLFMAGAIPGVLMASIFMVYIFIVAIRHPDWAPRAESVSWRVKFKALYKTSGPLVLVFFVLGGIYSGAVTPTEAAGLGAFVALLLGIIVYRKINLRTLRIALSDTVKINAMMCFIMLGGFIFAQALLIEGIPQDITRSVIALNLPPMGVIVAINILYLILGCIMDLASIMLITLPVVFPLIVALGFDPIWFGAVTVVNIEMAVITPPVGMNLFVIRGISGAPLSEVIRGSYRFVFLQALTLVLVIVFPQLALWLPGKMIRR
ncbi:TRAP transporter large permease [Chloroflexota bacterium]